MNQSSWHVKTLGEICEKPQYGFTASSASTPVGPKFLRITDLREGQLEWSEIPFCKCSDAEREKFKLRSGDIVVARIGATTGRTSLLVDPPESVFASYLIRLRPTIEVNPAFIFFFTQSADYWSWIDGNKGNNLKGGVNATLLAETKVRLPARPAQEKIAAILWKVQQAIQAEEKLVANARELKQSVMRQLFTHGLRNERQRETEIGLIPKSWRIVECDSVCKMITVGIVVKPASHYVDNAVPAFRSLNIREDRLDTTKMVFISKQANDTILSKSKLRTDDVLVVRTGYPGTSCVVPPEYNEANCIDLVIVRPKQDIVLSAFLSRFFNSESGCSQALRSSTGLAQQHLNVGAVKRTLVPIPHTDEQKEIAAILQTIDRKISVHERKRDAFSDLFHTLLNQLMTAQIRVDKLDIDTSEIEHLAGKSESEESK
jgi:type I restriction enzyme, S subunit